MIVGIDEVGRGCWAGPLLVVAARGAGELPAGLTDSKVLSKTNRQKLYYEIKLSCELGEGWVEPQEIDKLGLAEAMRLGVKRALEALQTPLEAEIILDGAVNYCPSEFKKAKVLVNADATEPMVMAASIWAKVRRDQWMAEAAIQYPQYGFDKHVGYGTALHRAMLARHGVCELHRLSYKPVRAVAEAPA